MLAGAGAFFVAWIAAAAGPVGSDTADSARSAQQPVAIELPELVALRRTTSRLRARLQRLPNTVESVRNPFRFADRHRATPPVPRGGATPMSAEPLRSSQAEAPLRLIGIAESRTAQGVARTAILSGLGKTFLVTTGDEVMSGYRVGAVGAEAIELLRADGSAVTLSFE